jgi:alkanesulfonate monooxygenase SsuD/methylene tetrahydromethanopterin reductase-like flavin-dependent oxidoreductase (luciferase family)
MKLGISTIITDQGIRPDVLAKACEERGFDWLVVAEHSHVPVSRATPYPAGGELPPECYRVYDPIVAVTAAAVATSKLLVGTGVLLLAQRDTIQTAKEVASADHIAEGRLLLGLGLGRNLEEIADHRIDPATRGKLLDEKLAAMKELWTKEEASSTAATSTSTPPSAGPSPSKSRTRRSTSADSPRPPCAELDDTTPAGRLWPSRTPIWSPLR